MTVIQPLLDAISVWAASHADIRACALVGSYARGTARPDSDVDLIMLTTHPARYRTDATWQNHITGFTVIRWHDADYGAVWSRHLTCEDAPEVEISFGALSWAQIDPVDSGTRQVMQDGHVILYDPDEVLKILARALVV